jgi:hypothetical protein
VRFLVQTGRMSDRLNWGASVIIVRVFWVILCMAQARVRLRFPTYCAMKQRNGWGTEGMGCYLPRAKILADSKRRVTESLEQDSV